MTVSSNSNLVKELVEALGIKVPNVKEFSLEVKPNSIVSVKVEYYPSIKQIKKLTSLIQNYDLVEKKQDVIK